MKNVKTVKFFLIIIEAFRYLNFLIKVVWYPFLQVFPFRRTLLRHTGNHSFL